MKIDVETLFKMISTLPDANNYGPYTYRAFNLTSDSPRELKFEKHMFTDGKWQWMLDVGDVQQLLSNEQILKGIQTSPRFQLPKEWVKNEHTNTNYMGGFLNAVKWMENKAR